MPPRSVRRIGRPTAGWRTPIMLSDSPHDRACSMTASAPKAFISWSSGKDSAFALLEAHRLGLAEIVGVLTTVNEVHDRVSIHGVRNTLLDRQVEMLGLPCLKVSLLGQPIGDGLHLACLLYTSPSPRD